MLVLGVVRQRGRIHGYGVQRELAAWRVETWTRVRPGSLYHALRQLTQEGKLRVAVGVEGDPGQGRPVYEITSTGLVELVELVERALTSVDPEQLSAGLACSPALPGDRVLELLRDQHRAVTANARRLGQLVPEFPDRHLPPHQADLLALWHGLLATTADWTAGLIERLERETVAPPAADPVTSAEREDGSANHGSGAAPH